jgi:hypothetical protein
LFAWLQKKSIGPRPMVKMNRMGQLVPSTGPPIFRLLYGLQSASCGNRAFEQDFHCKRSKDSLAMILPSMILPALRFSASKSEPISLVYATFIRTTPEKLREALTNGDFSDKQPEEPA